MNIIENLFVIVPISRTKQSAIVHHIVTECGKIDQIIIKLKKQIELYIEYRTALISEVVTGKVKVFEEVIK